MGDYTEFRFAAELNLDREDHPIARLLQFMILQEDFNGEIPDHPLFKCERWGWMLRSSSYYFPAETYSSLRWDQGDYYLTIQCNLKNYDKEIENFLDWISPYIGEIDDVFLGFIRNEHSEIPKLIYYRNNQCDICKIELHGWI